MHTVELLALAVQVAKQAGYQIRHDWFGGTGGGGCEFGGQKWIFLDLAVGIVSFQHRQRLLEKGLPMPPGRLRFIFRRHVTSLDVVNNVLPQLVVVAGYI